MNFTEQRQMIDRLRQIIGVPDQTMPGRKKNKRY